MNKNVIRTAVLSTALVPAAIVGTGLASAAPDLGYPVGGLTNIVVRVDNVQPGETCRLRSDKTGLTDIGKATGTPDTYRDIVSTDLSPGRYNLTVSCSKSGPGGPVTAFTGPLAGFYKVLYDSGSSQFTPG